MKQLNFQSLPSLAVGTYNEIVNKPARRSNPIPTKPDEDEEPGKPKEEPSKKKKKQYEYEVTC